MARRTATADISPEEREARIAELRARRKARVRTLAVRSAIGLAVLAALVLLLVYWLLSTLGGRDFLLSQVGARLPAGTTLEWRDAEGPASGPLTLHDVVFQQLVCPEIDDVPVPYGQCASPNTLRFSARRITIDPALRPLLGRLLRLDAAQVEGALLELPPSDDGEPFSLPRWPEVLPQIEPPLGLQADAIEIDGFRVLRGGEPMIDIASVRGGLDARSGRLRLQDVVVDSDRGLFKAAGEYAPGDDYRMDLTASALLPAPAGTTRPRLGLVARGDVAALDVALAGHAPAPIRMRLGLRGASEPRWTFAAASQALDPALLAGLGEPGTPVAFDLAASGTGGRARLQGDLAYGDVQATIQPSVVSLDEQRLEFDPLVIDALDGRITVTGHGDFKDPAAADVRYAVVARGLAWAPAPADGAAADPAATIRADADIGLAGTSALWAVVGKATLERDGTAADVELKGRGNTERLDLRSLVARTPGGRLDGSGQVAWAPALGWTIDADLAGFDPGYFAPGFDGAIDGRLSSSGTTRADGGLDASVDVDGLGGQLRGRRLAGSASFAMHGAAPGGTAPAAYEGEAALGIGDSRIDARGRVGDRLDIEASLAPLRLDDLLPGAAGRLDGTLNIGGGRSSPELRADLDGSSLRYGDYTADTLRLRGHLPWRSGGGELAVDATGLQAGIALDTLTLRARGAVEDLQLDAQARGEIGHAALSGSVRRGTNALWRGTLETLEAAPAVGAGWSLQSPATFTQAGSTRWVVDPACLASTVGGRLCASADWPGQGLSIDGQGLPLALVAPYLPEQDSGRPWFLDGNIDIDARLRPAGNAWQGHVTAASASGALRTSARSRRDVLSYTGLALDAEFDASRIDASLGLGFNGNGRIDARLRTGWDAYAPLEGTITAATSELTWLELFSPDIVTPTGRLDADIGLSGTRAQPALEGHAALTGFAAEIPALAIAIIGGEARLDALPDGSARISGGFGTGGEGRLAIDGSLGWQNEGTPLLLTVRGDNVLLSDTRDLRAVASPDIEVRYAAARPLQVRGRVHVPSARMDLERLSDGPASASPDVVVLDPVDPETGPALPLELDLTLAMGDDVHLNGFGLEGELTGELRVVSRAGREMTGHGLLEVGGRYEAYGQELAITRGRLSWSNTPVSDPVLDIRAERKVGDVTAGIDVDGRAGAPRARVWTDPASDESEALALLALGRPLSSLSGRQASDLDAASAALNAGGSLLAGQLGKQIGLDDAGMMDSRALGGSVFGIGKQLSPRLYVGFGVSLLGTGQVLTLKYLLRKGFDIEIESSTLESRGSINYRHER